MLLNTGPMMVVRISGNVGVALRLDCLYVDFSNPGMSASQRARGQYNLIKFNLKDQSFFLISSQVFMPILTRDIEHESCAQHLVMIKSTPNPFL